MRPYRTVTVTRTTTQTTVNTDEVSQGTQPIACDRRYQRRPHSTSALSTYRLGSEGLSRVVLERRIGQGAGALVKALARGWRRIGRRREVHAAASSSSLSRVAERTAQRFACGSDVLVGWRPFVGVEGCEELGTCAERWTASPRTRTVAQRRVAAARRTGVGHCRHS